MPDTPRPTKSCEQISMFSNTSPASFVVLFRICVTSSKWVRYQKDSFNISVRITGAMTIRMGACLAWLVIFSCVLFALESVIMYSGLNSRYALPSPANHINQNHAQRLVLSADRSKCGINTSSLVQPWRPFRSTPKGVFRENAVFDGRRMRVVL